MSGLIDRIQDRRTTDQQVRVLAMADEETDDVLDALASDNGRSALRALSEEPCTPSEIADRIDTSVQNVHYHVSDLSEAGLVEAVDTVYSEKGTEMTVYGPTYDPLVLVGDEDRTPAIGQSLTRVLGAIALLGVASLFIQWGAKRLVGAGHSSPSAVGPASWIPDAARARPSGGSSSRWLNRASSSSPPASSSRR